MTTLQINDRSFACPSNWAELKWSQFITLKNFAERCENRSILPNQPKESLQDDIDSEQMENEILYLFCGVDRKTILRVEPDDRKRFVACLIQRFIDPLTHTSAVADEKRNLAEEKKWMGKSRWDGYKFLSGDEWLHFPRYGRDYENEIVPLDNVSAAQWCEATDLYLEDKWKYAPVIAAVLCKGEENDYAEKLVRNRAEGMKSLDMEKIFSLFVALNDAHKRMMELCPDCYAPKNVSNEIARNTTFFSWNELLLWTGHFRADEIDRVRLMNCYDFMALVNGRIKSGN